MSYRAGYTFLFAFFTLRLIRTTPATSVLPESKHGTTPSCF